jgi:NarL family two-component system response regulator LiaR
MRRGRDVKKAVILYGLCGGLLIVALRFGEYHFLVIEHSIEIYGALIAALFAGLGLWLGLSEILQRIADGMSTREIATALFVSNQGAIPDRARRDADLGWRAAEEARVNRARRPPITAAVGAAR